jgi:hypothetical protein
MLTWIAMKSGWQWASDINNYAARHPSFPGMDYPKPLFELKTPKKGALSKISLVGMVGDELLSVFKILGEQAIIR